MDTLANIVKTKREKLGISQFKLAKDLGYTTPQFVSNFERELAGIPLSKLKKLSKILKLSTNEMRDALVSEYETEIKKALK